MAKKIYAFEPYVKACRKRPTKSGILVQSVGEQRIADFLFDNDIDFEHDVRITLPDEKSYYEECWVRPDFMIKQGDKKVTVVIEFWGMRYVSDDYDERVEKKKSLYKNNGIKLIEISPTDLPFLNQILTEELRDLKVMS